ncbi:MAG: hypothetical protein QOC87_1752 [Actinomycetota bacterium]|nr:hypothetical protein [Actinomycetota bacterium]
MIRSDSLIHVDRRSALFGSLLIGMFAFGACSGQRGAAQAAGSYPIGHGVTPTQDSTDLPPGVKPPPHPLPRATLPPGVTEPPAWLGHRALPKRPDGFGVIRPTPKILRDRQFATTDLLPRPPNNRFHWSIQPVPQDVLARSTWKPGCPVASSDLSYLTMSFWGFDDLTHTGEMLVNASVAHDVVNVFRQLFVARFPIEEMRVASQADIHAPPTGDGNDTGSFECRPVTGGSAWSQHSYGLAIDVDPFQNPYVRGDLVVPERASAYMDRTWRRRGMTFPGDVVTDAFSSIGWGWGGEWHSLKDWMHFSQSGG